MMSLGSRAVVPETLEQRIARRLNEALDQQIAAGFYAGGTRGLTDAEEMLGGDVSGLVRLSVEDVSRIAAAEARAWF